MNIYDIHCHSGIVSPGIAIENDFKREPQLISLNN